MNASHTGRTVKIIALVAILAALGFLYVRHVRKVTEEETAAIGGQSGPVYAATVSGLTLTLKKDGMPIQTLVLGEDATAGMNLIAGSTIDVAPFITGADVNFDGYPDAAMLVGIGYGGVNAFYDYYIFNPMTERLEKDPVLTGIGNPVFDPAAKTITGDARDAQDSFKTVYSWKNGGYVKGPTISDSTGQVETED